MKQAKPTPDGEIIGEQKKKEKEIEEKVVIPFLNEYLGYDIDLIKRQVSVRFGSYGGTKIADIVCYVTENGIKKPYLVVEVKTPENKLDIGQAESYAQRLGTPYFVITNGDDWCWYRTGKQGQGTSEEIKGEIEPPKQLGKINALKFRTMNETDRVISYCHDVIWNEKSITPEGALKELTKFLIAKIIDERQVSDYEKEEYDFCVKRKDEDLIDIKNRINVLLLEAKKIDPELFVDRKPEIELKPYSVIKIVHKLQEYSLMNTEKVEMLGQVYQELLKETYTSRLMGQRFTPRNIVDFMVELIEAKLSETVLDPACGTGGFLISTLRYVKKEINEAFERGDIINPIEKFRDYAKTKLYGMDIESTVVQLAKANMILHGDGHNKIICHDGLYDSPKNEVIQDVINENDGFDIIITNPPFGGKKVDPKLLLGYKLGEKSKTQLLQVLFIERCLNLLRKGGKLGIVLPDGILSNASLFYVRDYIREKAIIKAVVSLPKGTFTPYGADPKASLLFLQKKKYDGEKQGSVLMGEIKNIGYTVSGKGEEEKDLPKIKIEIEKIGGLKW